MTADSVIINNVIGTNIIELLVKTLHYYIITVLGFITSLMDLSGKNLICN